MVNESNYDVRPTRPTTTNDDRWPMTTDDDGDISVNLFDFDKLRIQGRMHNFEKMLQDAFNQVLTLPDYRTQKMLQIPLKIYDLQNDLNILVAKQ